MLPCRRERYFHTIDVFASNPKINLKTIEIWFQKSKKIKKNIKKNESANMFAFNIVFLVIFGTILPPKLEAKIVDFSYFFC